jgi:predicted phosphoribosyltransferase
MLRFGSHAEAGAMLAPLLDEFAGYPGAVIVALSAEGVDVAHAIAKRLDRPMTFLVSDSALRGRFEGRTVILVDDGFDVPDRLTEAVEQVRRHRPAAVIAAAPIVSDAALLDAARIVDRLVSLATPRPFRRVGFWYEDRPRRPRRPGRTAPARRRVRPVSTA